MNEGPSVAEGPSDFIKALGPDLERACRQAAALARRTAGRGKAKKAAPPPLVGLQLPDGLRGHFRELSEYLERCTGAACALLVEPCCGACMAETHPALDLVIHVAHDPLLPLAGEGGHRVQGAGRRVQGRAQGAGCRVLFVRYRPTMEITRALEAALPMLEPPVGVLTTSTHIRQLPAALGFLRQRGMRPATARGKRTGKPGVVLGCDFSAARKLAPKVRSFLFLGSGSFHPVGMALATGKKVVGADPYDGQARTFEDVKERMLRRRFAAIELCRSASSFGVLLGLYPGQQRRAAALGLKRALESHGRKAYILAARRFEPEYLTHLGIEALVSTACSRIALDDQARYPLPVLTPVELEIVLGKRSWDGYILDELA